MYERWGEKIPILTAQFILHLAPCSRPPSQHREQESSVPPRATMTKKISGKKATRTAAAATADATAAGDLKTERQLEALRRDGHLP